MKRNNKKNRYISRYQSGGMGNLNRLQPGQLDKAFRNIKGQNYSGNIDAGSPAVDFSIPPTAMDTVRAYHYTNVPAMGLLNNVDQDAYKKLQMAQNKKVTAGTKNDEFNRSSSIHLKQSGGMYGDNQIPAGMGSTAMTVYQESNPEVQAQREQSVEQEAQNIRQESTMLGQELMADEQQAKMDIAEAGQAGGKFDAAVGYGVEGIKGLDKLGVFDKAKQKLASKAAEKIAAEAAAKAAVKKGLGEGALQTGKTALGKELGAKFATDQGTKLVTGEIGKGSLSLAGEGATVLGKEAAKTIGTEGAKQASTGLIQSSINPNAAAMVANIGGKALSMAADDGDATKWNAGEVTGDVLGKAGEYAGYGAMLGSVVPGIGNVAGALGGAIIGGGVAAVQGLTGRKKARRAEAKADAERKNKIAKANEKMMASFGASKAAAQAGSIRQKTYSGYDLGRNVSYKFGGYNPMPRYAA